MAARGARAAARDAGDRISPKRLARSHRTHTFVPEAVRRSYFNSLAIASRERAKRLFRPFQETRVHIPRCPHGGRKATEPISRGARHVGWTKKQQKCLQRLVLAMRHSDEGRGDHRAACS
jgi:hypothetical protein